MHFYLFLIYDISYDCENVFVLFCLMTDDWYAYYSSSYRSQTAWPIHSAGTQGMIHDFVCFHPSLTRMKILMSVYMIDKNLTLFSRLLRLWCFRSP